jgi:competence protein ComEC
MSWQEIPFVRLILPFILGIVAAIYIDNSHPWLWWGCIVLLFSLVAIRNNKSYKNRFLFGLLVYLFLFVIGFQICYEENELRADNHFHHHAKEEKNVLIVQLDEIPLNSKWTRTRTIVKYINGQPCLGNLLMYLERDSLSEQLDYGDWIAVNTYVNELEAPKNPNQFNYKEYLHFNNIHYQAFVKPDSWKLVKKEQGNIFQTAIFQLRKHSLNTLEKYLSEDSYAVGAALILGYREEISEDVEAAYSDTGAIHVLSVSGLHVGIVSVILSFLFNLIPKRSQTFRKWIQPSVIIVALWLFTFLTGASPSVLRAATMFSFVIIGYAIGRPSSIYNTLAISAFILLFIYPYLIKNVGFQLSYLAIIGIVYFQSKIYKLIKVPTKLGDYFWQLTSVSIAAQLSTMPVTLFFFHSFPLLFWLSGLIVIPASTLILALGLFTLMAEWIFPYLASWSGWLLDYMVYWVNESIFWMQQLPMNKINDIWLPPLSMVLLSGIIISLIVLIQNQGINQRRNQIKAFFAILIMALTMASFSSSNHIEQQNKKRVVVYNVYKHSVISFMDGHSLYRFQSADVDDKSILFNVKGHENALRVQQRQVLNIGGTVKNETIYSNGNIVYFNEKIFLIIDETFDIERITTKLKVDYVILTGNPRLFLKDLIAKIDCQQIIVDASNSQKKIGYWKKDAAEFGVNLYDVDAGAWQIVE